METQARPQLFDLYPQDRAALERIKERLEIHSSALCVRLAIRSLARRLENPAILADKPAQNGAEEGGNG